MAHLLLNKTFFHLIPSFARKFAPLSPSSSPFSKTPIIFHCSCNFFTRITQEISSGRTSQVSTTLPLMEISILASCNGVLLVRFMDDYYSYYVFNPITGGIMFVDYPLHSHSTGLAVDLDGQYFHFKLVRVDRKFTSSKGNIVRFSVLVPSSSGVVLKSLVEFVSESSIRLRSRPVYVHGCLHWLGSEGKEIVVFNVEKEKARIINGPVKGSEPGLQFRDKWFGFADWFGLADGSLQFVHTTLQPEEIVVHSYDYFKDEWQVKQKIANICIPKNKYSIMNGLPLFFDGQRLFLKLGMRSEEYSLVVMYDILSDKWERTGIIERSPDVRQPFFSIFPTPAKVSDKYLPDCITEFLRGVLLGYISKIASKDCIMR